jgi:hypothetical protein
MTDTPTKTARNTKKDRIYSANEICNIIKTCSKHGVTNIKISGIEVNFMDQGTDSPQAGMSWTPPKRNTKAGTPAPLKALELNEDDLEEIKDLELAQRAISDPVGFEDDIIRDFMNGEADNEANGYS